VTHFIGQAAYWYAWLVWGLLRIEWWLLHCRLFIAAVLGYDAVKYLAWPQLRRLWWLRVMPEPREDEPCS
jgi:hypothetical protein